PHEDFPVLTFNPKTITCTLDAKTLIGGLGTVVYCASQSTVKPELASVYVSGKKNILTLTATDSYRLAEKNITHKSIPEFDAVLVPAKNAVELMRIFDVVGGETQISVEESQVLFLGENISISSRIIEGTFPDYKQIIPQKSTSTATLLKQDLLTSLKRATPFLDGLQQVTLTINPSEKVFSIQAKNNEVGEYTDALDAALTGEEITMHYNYRYFIDALPTLASDSITLSFVGYGKPVVVKGVGDESFLYLVMPMNR
ncbi:MAG: DNA polymerase III subunit beta, partial [Candidatus Magasanikbacteria bacterium CG10_big_fil_rev_8_21_14_0_10_43_6]